MAKSKEEINESYLTSNIGKDAKKKFNMLYHDLIKFAISKGFAELSKGDLLAKMIENGAAQYATDPASYFKK